jgi:hypothetical protein
LRYPWQDMNSSMPGSFSWPLFAAFCIVAIVASYLQSKRSNVAWYGGRPSLKIGVISLVATAIGVTLSYCIVLKHFALSVPNIAGAVIVTFIANYGSYVALKSKDEFDWQDFLLFIKEGFLWVTVYPAVAAALGFSGFKISG